MIILGSAYQGVTQGLRGRLRPPHEVRDFAMDRAAEEQLSDVDVLLLGSLQVSARLLDNAPRLRLIHQHGRGVDGVDLRAAAERGIWVANAPDGNGSAVAEHGLGLMLALAKGIHGAGRVVARGELGAPVATELADSTVGILGLGAAGSELAVRAKALGMRVLATKTNPTICDVPAAVDVLGSPKDVDYVLRESDFVVVALPLTETTRGMIDRAALRRMKRSAYLINIARAAVVEYRALYAALEDETIAGAAFDVFWREPADADDPILELPNFLLTPHQAGFSSRSVDRVARVIADNVQRLFAGEPLQNAIVEGPRVAKGYLHEGLNEG